MSNEAVLEIKELLQQLTEAVKELNSVPYIEVIFSFLSLIAPAVTIIILLVERYENRRPYLQISFELVRSTLACIVFRNTGNSPLKIENLKFRDDFIVQLKPDTQTRLKNKEKTDIMIFPNRNWVMSFDVTVSDIISDFKEKKVNIHYIYSGLGVHRKRYKEEITIDFEEYKGMLDYISDLDEFKRSVDKLRGTFDSFTKSVSQAIEVTNLEDEFVKRILENPKKQERS